MTRNEFYNDNQYKELREKFKSFEEFVKHYFNLHINETDIEEMNYIVIDEKNINGEIKPVRIALSFVFNLENVYNENKENKEENE